MNAYQEKRRCMGHHRPGFSSSKSATSSTTTVTDSRVVGGDGSSNLSLNHSAGATVIATDHGAVAGGLELAGQAITENTKLAANLSATGASMFEGALDAVSDSSERLALAYQSGQAGDQVGLKYAGFVVVGLAALAFVASRK